MSDQAFIFWFIVLGIIAFGSFVHLGSLDKRPEGDFSPGDRSPGGRSQGNDEER